MLKAIAKTNGKSRQGVVKHQRLYRQWYTMRRRCYDPKFICYRYYGAKGIKVCDEWRTCYEAFQTWALAHGWKKNLTLDRIDCNGDYEPANCRWLTPAEQSCNRLTWNVHVTIDGMADLAGHWADKFKIPRGLAYRRIAVLGWDPVRAVTTPSAGRRARLVTFDGRSLTFYQWAKVFGVCRTWLYQQVKEGHKPCDILKRLKEKKRGI